ncbi:DUF4189 domain-containing protein [Rhizobium sp. KVB221]|uniref:DUF4189 domain-containing protein n=1 Tax=Rhizobium setariae TaxID=2801340 RepID=A0A936YRV8_9HYPH|nr:DUF4189 domain-containing protein [Rhizobium setariae]MBL0373084.1 DUF4189 domain-containing protein [Rhizobium setariae]
MRMRFFLGCVAALVIGSAPSGPAFAWGCTAVASDGAYGYSNDWPSEQDAELTALKQCDKYTTSDDCQTESCDPNG